MVKKNKDYQIVTSDHINYLADLLNPKDVKHFKSLVPELKENWQKRQVFRTETEMRFSVLNDSKHPTNGSKYWQSVREQNTHFENLVQLSFDSRKLDIETKQLQNKIKKEKDKLEKELLEIELDKNIYTKAQIRLVAKHRMREIMNWSMLKIELDDGSFDNKNVDTHQLESYGLAYKQKKESLTPGSSQPEVFNVLGQLKTLERIKKEKQEQLQHQKKKLLKK